MLEPVTSVPILALTPDASFSLAAAAVKDFSAQQKVRGQRAPLEAYSASISRRSSLAWASSARTRHQAPGVQRPGQLQHAAERVAALLQGAMKVVGVSGHEPCARALDGSHHVSDDRLTQEGFDLLSLHITVLRRMGGSPTSAPHPPENLTGDSRPLVVFRALVLSGDCKAHAGPQAPVAAA